MERITHEVTQRTRTARGVDRRLVETRQFSHDVTVDAADRHVLLGIGMESRAGAGAKLLPAEARHIAALLVAAADAAESGPNPSQDQR